jgi:hypothetical protein
VGQPAKYKVTSFQWFEDDAAEGSATQVAAINTSADLDVDTTYRLRIGIDNFGGDSGSVGAELEYNVGAGDVPVTTSSSVIKAVTGSYLSEDDATSEVLSQGATFVAGKCTVDGKAGAVTVGSAEETEFVFTVQVVSADVADNDTINFDVTDVGGVALDAIPDNAPVCTVNKPAAQVDVDCTFGGTIQLTKYNVDVVEGINVNCTFPPAVWLSASAVDISATVTVELNKPTLTLQSFNAQVSQPIDIDCTFGGTVNLSVNSATVVQTVAINCTHPTLNMSSFNVDVQPYTVIDVSFPSPLQLQSFDATVVLDGAIVLDHAGIMELTSFNVLVFGGGVPTGGSPSTAAPGTVSGIGIGLGFD